MRAIDPRYVIAARALEYVDRSGRCLANGAPPRASAGGDGGVRSAVRDGFVGEGCFGEVNTFVYGGAVVAVKELKTSALGGDAKDIGEACVWRK